MVEQQDKRKWKSDLTEMVLKIFDIPHITDVHQSGKTTNLIKLSKELGYPIVVKSDIEKARLEKEFDGVEILVYKYLLDKPNQYGQEILVDNINLFSPSDIDLLNNYFNIRLAVYTKYF